MMSNPKDYTICWICAIETEYTAAQAFFDEEHDPPRAVPPDDDNDYALGKIANHNVVTAVLPDGEYGVSSAASVATNMIRTFPNIRVGLMVGIGGGAPTPEHDIRLGDIVVSSPKNGTGGVYQYDFGKAIQDQEFVQTGFLDQPSSAVRTTVNGLKSQYRRKGHQIRANIESILEKWSRLKNDFSRPPQESDRLYASDFVHTPTAERDCNKFCITQLSKIVERSPRKDDADDPLIHYGVIASGNSLMKDAIIRDRLAKDKGILCFEMEAAGLMNRFPFLVIRGICDYSDSHKNKEWQGYAAMTAAAYPKDLLKRIAPSSIETEEPLVSSIKQLTEQVYAVGSSVEQIRTTSQDQDIMKWLNAPDPSTNFNKAQEMQHPGTGQWFLESEQFIQWNQHTNSFLWLHGLSGCGKTVLSSTVIGNLVTKDRNLVVYFYFDFSDPRK